MSSVQNNISYIWGAPGIELGPVVVLAFVNEMTNIVSTDSLLVADDYKIYKIIASIKHSIALQNDLNKIFQWCRI